MSENSSNSSDTSWIASYPPGDVWDSNHISLSLPDMFEKAATEFANHVALDFLGRKLTYTELLKKINQVACGLQHQGFRPGDRIGIMLPNCPQYIILYYAIQRIGAIVVNFNPLTSSKHIKEQINDAGVCCIATLNHHELAGKIFVILDEVPSLKTIIFAELKDFLPFPLRLLFPLVKRKELIDDIITNQHLRFSSLLDYGSQPQKSIIDPQHDIAVLQYTGGTTGIPKAAMLTHANIYTNTRQCAHWFHMLQEGKDHVLGILPFFHVFAMTGIMNLSFIKGLEIIIYPKLDMAKMMKDIKRKQVSVMIGVPTLYAAMLQYAQKEKVDFSSIKFAVSGGAPLSVDLHKRFEEVAGCALLEGYGLTEASPVISCNPLYLDETGHSKPLSLLPKRDHIVPEHVPLTGSVGLPFPGTTVFIRDQQTHERFVSPGLVGEICIRGPQVMSGYYRHADESNLVLHDGELYTGDLGYLDEDGYLYVVDRIKEMIITNGYNVYPRNVEEALLSHPDIIEAAVIGVPHSERGELVKAYIKCREGSTLSHADIKNYLKHEHLAAYEIPKEIEIRDSLPKSLIGKISKKDLKGIELH